MAMLNNQRVMIVLPTLSQSYPRSWWHPQNLVDFGSQGLTGHLKKLHILASGAKVAPRTPPEKKQVCL